jgi:H+/gluconate symporter-like permease
MMHGCVRNGEINFHESTMELEISAQLHALATLSPKSIKHVINQTGFWMVSKFTLGEAKIHHTYHTQNSGYVFNLYIITVPVLS